MSLHQSPCFIGTVTGNGVKNRGMFAVGGLDSLGVGEIELAHDTNTLNHSGVRVCQLGIPRGGNKLPVKSFVKGKHDFTLRGALGFITLLNGLKSFDACGLRLTTQTFDSRQLQNGAQFIKLVEELEIKLIDLPPGADLHTKKAFARQTGERFTHRGAACSGALDDLVFGKALTR